MTCKYMQTMQCCMVLGQTLTAFFVVEDRDGDSPLPLSGDAPIRSAGRHGGDAGNPTGGEPIHLANCVEGLLLEPFY